MEKSQNPNLEILELAVGQLDDLADAMVFVGGCATGLLISDPAAAPIRATEDVDVIAQVFTKSEYYRLSEKLRQRGFREDTSEDAPLCRWKGDATVLDVMPADPKILGFGSDWYLEALDSASRRRLPSGREISLITAPYFLLTKLDAFNGRGKGDYMSSRDIEDIVLVLDGRPELIAELEAASQPVIAEIASRFDALSEDPRFIEAVAGHMPPDDASQARVTKILEKINAIAGLR